MKYARRVGLCGLVATMMTATALTAPEPADAVTVKAVTYDQLGRLVRGLKGKVVIVDIWSFG
jgi:hypothetical protein